jgi:hypothetical protein
MLSENVKIMPAFKGKLDNPKADFTGATDYGSLWVGEKALYLYDFDVIYIPLEELASIELDTRSSLATSSCCSCNNFSVSAHDLRVTTTGGQSIRTRVISTQKALGAFGRISELNASVRCAVI